MYSSLFKTKHFFLFLMLMTMKYASAITICTGEYYHFNITDKLIGKFKKNNSIHLNILNPTTKNFLFYLILEDNMTHDYWSKLNFKTTLTPGINTISFDLDQYLGEKGSVAFKRKLNFSKLKKMYAYIKKNNSIQKIRDKIFIKKLSFSREQKLKLPIDAFAFNFQGSKTQKRINTIFTNITEKTLYLDDRKYGFTHINLWQNRDSKILPHHLSNVISVHSANFKIKLRPGKYKVRLIWDELGYWEIPFWKKRILTVNNHLMIQNKRGVNEFIETLFRFESEPDATMGPYELYLKKIFKPNDFTVSNKKGFINFKFSGDPSGVSLNNLFIWPEIRDEEMQKFFNDLHIYNKKKFNQGARKIIINSDKKNKALSISKINFNQSLLPFQDCSLSNKSDQADWVFFNKSPKNIGLCISSSSNAPIVFSVSNFKNKYNKIPSKAFFLNTFQYSLRSLDLNHETYIREGHFLKPNNFKLNLNHYQTRYVSLSFYGKVYPPGSYTGFITLKQNNIKIIKHITILILNAKISPLPIRAGFLGINSFPDTFFDDQKLNKIKIKNAFSSLQALYDLGLTLFTDFPLPSAIGQVKHQDKTLFYYKSNLDEIYKKIKNNQNKNFIFLYSDEASGYSNSVEEDISRYYSLKSKYPKLELGGFANPSDWEKAKKLISLWQFIFYSDIPSKKFLNIHKSKNFGVYNLCSSNNDDLSFCFGILLYRLYREGITHYIEWHASAIHNDPFFDLDGRESDIGIFYPQKNGLSGKTKRYVMTATGLEYFHKINFLETNVSNIHLSSLKNKIKNILAQIMDPHIFPIKNYKSIMMSKNNDIYHQIDLALMEMHNYLQGTNQPYF